MKYWKTEVSLMSTSESIPTQKNYINQKGDEKCGLFGGFI